MWSRRSIRTCANRCAELVAEPRVLRATSRAGTLRRRRSRTSSDARASKCQRYGGKSHDQPTDVAGVGGLDHRARPAPGCGHQGDAPAPHDVERVHLRHLRGWSTASSKPAFFAQPAISARWSAKEPGLPATRRSAHPASARSTSRSVARIAASSSVTSMPTGHQVMHRPHRPQPDVELVEPRAELVCEPLPVASLRTTSTLPPWM